jgi:DNA modification methylase
VLDPFGGYGTTLVAAEKSRRRACVIEIDLIYVDVAIHRWQQLGGGSAIHGASGRGFSDIERDQSLRQSDPDQHPLEGRAPR